MSFCLACDRTERTNDQLKAWLLVLCVAIVGLVAYANCPPIGVVHTNQVPAKSAMYLPVAVTAATVRAEQWTERAIHDGSLKPGAYVVSVEIRRAR